MVLENLAAVLRRWLSDVPDAVEPVAPAVIAADAGDTGGGLSPPVDLATLSRRLGEEDINELSSLLELLVDSLTQSMARLDSAIDAKDAQKAHDAAHSAKSAATSASAPRMTELLQKLETDTLDADWKSLVATSRQVRSEFDRIIAFCRNRPERD